MIKDITLGQYFPMNSVVHKLDPRMKLLFVTAFIVMVFVSNNFVSLAFYGTPDEEGINRYDLSSLRLNGHAYLDLSGG